MLATIEHINFKDVLPTLTKAYKILKKGGNLIITTPTPAGKPVLEFLSFRLKLINEFQIRDHKHYFSVIEMKSLLKQVGFKVKKAKTFQFGLNAIYIAKKI